uniref:B30.2/SPRY domain-containing protein n=1 Tax=Maylandia zebra TaxID=106582 RepID=A0A3P9C6X1_9CICH
GPQEASFSRSSLDEASFSRSAAALLLAFLKWLSFSPTCWIVFVLSSDSCQLTIDTNTVHTKLQLSDNNRKVTHVEEVQSYPDHPDRFDGCYQLLCRTGLTGRCYWEVEWRGRVFISVSYRRIGWKGDSDYCAFGWNDQSWSLSCYDGRPDSVYHNQTSESVSSSTSSSVSNRVAVYVDCPAGTLSFYRVSSDTLIHLHTFNTTFTEPLYPGFGLWFGSSCLPVRETLQGTENRDLESKTELQKPS